MSRGSEVEVAVRRELGSRFALEHPIGQGSCSIVYLARDLDATDAVSLKVAPRSSPKVSVQAFSRALTLVARLDHPHLVGIRGWGVTPTFLWYACPYVEGRSLADRLRVNGTLELDACVRLADQIAGVVQYAQQHGVAHGALTPENVLLDTRGNCLVRDFQASTWRTGPPAPAGSPQGFFVSESYADQYALAALVFACLSGARWTVADRLRGPPWGTRPDLSALPPHIPPSVGSVLERTLTPASSAPFASMVEFARALHSDPTGKAVTAAPAAGRVLFVERDDLPAVLHPFQRGYQVALGALGVAGMVAIGAGLWSRPAKPATIVMAAPVMLAPDTPLVTSPVPAPVSPESAAPPVTPRSPRVRTSRGRRAGLGFLSVSTVPWGRLYIDGVMVGDTPQVALPIAAGPHVVEVERMGFRTNSRKIELAPGESLRVTDVELQGVRP